MTPSRAPSGSRVRRSPGRRHRGPWTMVRSRQQGRAVPRPRGGLPRPPCRQSAGSRSPCRHRATAIAPASAFGSNAPKLQQTREAPACSASSSSPAAVASSIGIGSPPVRTADPPTTTSLSARFASTAPSNGAGQAARPALLHRGSRSRAGRLRSGRSRGWRRPVRPVPTTPVATASGRFARW